MLKHAIVGLSIALLSTNTIAGQDDEFCRDVADFAKTAMMARQANVPIFELQDSARNHIASAAVSELDGEDESDAAAIEQVVFEIINGVIMRTYREPVYQNQSYVEDAINEAVTREYLRCMGVSR